MPIQKQIVQFFFGATDQDTAKRGVGLGDLVSAENIRQKHPGQFEKRGGFTQTAQTYDDPASIVAESITSPDGSQVIVQDATTEIAFARGATSTSFVARGSAKRVFATPKIRFPSIASGEQAAPMAKQAGDYYVWLHDDQHFVVARRSPDSGSLIEITDPITINGGYGATPSTHAKSFAILDSALFDADALWIFWVDWTTGTTNRDSVWAYRVPHANINSPTAFRIAAGSVSNLCATSISVGISGKSRCTLCVCGNEGVGGPTVEFRSNSVTSVNSYSSFYQIAYTSGSIISTLSGSVSQTSSYRVWASGGCCMLTAKDEATYLVDHFYYAYWGCSAVTAYAADLFLVEVDEITGVMTVELIDTVTEPNYPIGTNELTCYVGSIVGREVSGGVTIAAQHRIYYWDSALGFVTPKEGTVDSYLDTLYVEAYDWYWSTRTASTKWKKQGAWLAHNWFERDDGVSYLITGWTDPALAQVPYHLRKLDDGEIVAQFAIGEGAIAGGCSDLNTQLTNHVSDVASPMLATSPVANPDDQVVVPMRSANVNGSQDIANVVFEKPTSLQRPKRFRDFALFPGPVPVVVSGWQDVREAGPLVWPSTAFFCWGEGSS